MDPFTEKLLERTRARRENLQKKMAERPTATNRQMAKRSREPLGESNSLLSEPAVEKVPPIPKPSPSKRRCSDENALIVSENTQPDLPHAPTPPSTTPPVIVDKKPPIAPTSTRPASSLSQERLTPTPSESQPMAVPSQPAPEQEQKVVEPPRDRDVTDQPSVPAPLQRERQVLNEASGPATSGMKARLQRLAAHRNMLDADDTGMADTPSLSPLRVQRYDVPPDPLPPTSSTPMGRKGRFANLAATIGSWEDDLSHPTVVRKDNAQGAPVKPGTAAGSSSARAPPAAGGVSASINARQTSSSLQSVSKQPPAARQPPVYSPVKSSRVVLPSAQHTEVPVPEPRSSQSTSRGLASPNAKLPKGAIQSSPQKGPSSSSSTGKLDSGKALSSASPQKPGLPNKLSAGTAPSSSATPQAKLRDVTTTRDVTPAQSKASTAGTPGVKSFLERFGERCQELNTNNSPSVAKGSASTPAPSISSPAGPVAGTPRSRLLQERLNKFQGSTATADLTQKQKMDREAELAQIRNRFQKSNVSQSQQDGTQEEACDQQSQISELTAPSDGHPSPARKMAEASEMDSKHLTIVASSPLKKVDVSVEKIPEESKKAEAYGGVRNMEEKDEGKVEEEEKDEEEVIEREMNVDGSINSEVINELFDGVLEESNEPSAEDEDGEEDEEDRLNISSMSLLTPLAETVAAVVKSPERKFITSTPASSFLEKSRTPESVPKPNKFQRTRALRAGSTDSLENLDVDHNLLYSIDAYRSTRVKAEPERQHVKQVIVRKEDVAQKMEQQSRPPGHISIKQRMKDLSNELNLQQTVIHQASQALNCCTDEEHGKGSQVEAEAERLLLIATERRVALKAELERLKVEGPGAERSRAPQSSSSTASKGSIGLLELRLPLKADFVCSTANRPESGSHYFFVMIRAGAENSVATPLASTRSALSGDALTFSTKFTLSDVSNDFEIDIEVYYLVHKKELNSDKRKKPTKSKAITPKRFLAITKSNLQTPAAASPGGPNAVRTSNFLLVGSHKLTLASIGRNKFPLEKVPFLCPLEGHIYLKMQCEVGSRVEEKGFLTMFEDVSGFGAWHRRWCVLSGYCISYWTYPDDERRKNPIGRINLANCTSRQVEPANREFCARPNTFELITVRPQREDDRETLVSQCHNTMCVTKNWLSADTKDERNLWMQKLNQILVDLRTWQPDSCYRPV